MFDECASANSPPGCCAAPAPDMSRRLQHLPPRCPGCGASGKRVETKTVKALLAVSLQAIRPTAYYFCRTPDCPVVYFSSDGAQIFGEADLREQVYQKHPGDDDVYVCYCFRYTAGLIRAELQMIGASTVVEAISAGIQAGQCACEIRNPQGSCCLGNIRATVKRLQTQDQPAATTA